MCNFCRVTPGNSYKVTLFLHYRFLRDLGPVWYMCLKTENCYLRIFIKIRVGEKMY